MANGLYQIKRVMNGAAGRFGFVFARVDTIEEFRANVRALEVELEQTKIEARAIEKELERARFETRTVGTELKQTLEQARIEGQDSQGKIASLEAAFSESEAARKSAESRIQESEEAFRRHVAAAETQIAAAEAQIADVQSRLLSAEAKLEAATAEVQRLTAQLLESQQRHDAAAAEVQHLTAEVQRLTEKLQESETRNAASVAEVEALNSQLRNSEARHAAAAEDAQRLTGELVESKASHMAALAEVQRLTAANAAEVERLTLELLRTQAKYTTATAEGQALTDALRAQTDARVEQEQFATIFRRKTEELSSELSRREAELVADLTAEKAQSERLTREAARLTAENARLVCEHADMTERVAEKVESDRLASPASRLATENADRSKKPRRLTFHPFKAHEDSMRPILEQQILDMDAPQPDAAVQQKIELGKSLSEAIDLYKARKELSDIASVINAQSLSDRLSPHQFNRLLKQQEDTLHLDQRKKYYRESDPAKIYQGISYELVRKLILSDPTIASSLNIGCNYAYMDWLLAKQFENVVFHAIDVNTNLVEINSDLKLPNTEFYSGYALELLESGQLQADVVYTSSASTVIRNAELRTYARLIAQKAKYFLISEPIWALPGGEIIDPKMVHPLDSVPAYVQREPLTGDFGYLCWIHNYRAIIEGAGFDVVEYRFYKPEIGPHHWCVVLGQNKDVSLWKSEGAA